MPEPIDLTAVTPGRCGCASPMNGRGGRFCGVNSHCTLRAGHTGWHEDHNTRASWGKPWTDPDDSMRTMPYEPAGPGARPGPNAVHGGIPEPMFDPSDLDEALEDYDGPPLNPKVDSDWPAPAPAAVPGQDEATPDGPRSCASCDELKQRKWITLDRCEDDLTRARAEIVELRGKLEDARELAERFAPRPGRDEATPGELMDLLDTSWSVIANAGCGATHDGTIGWHNESEEWQQAAERLRERWHAVLRVWCRNRTQPPRPDPAHRPGGGETRAAVREALLAAARCQPDNFRIGEDVEYADEETEAVMARIAPWVLTKNTTSAPGEVTLDPVRGTAVSDRPGQSDTEVIERCARAAHIAHQGVWPCGGWVHIADDMRDRWRAAARAVLAEAGRAAPTAADDTVALAWDLLLALEHSMLPLSKRPVEELREERRQLVDRARAHLGRVEEEADRGEA